MHPEERCSSSIQNNGHFNTMEMTWEEFIMLNKREKLGRPLLEETVKETGDVLKGFLDGVTKGSKKTHER